MNREWIDYFKVMLATCVIVVGYHCVTEITDLRGRVAALENTLPNIPEITITIPDDWVK
jgi:hypothetical protein